MTWENHLFGNEENKGLVSTLSQRSGIIRKLSFIMPRDKLRIFAEGLLFSLLNYCIDVYRIVWVLDTYDEDQRQSTAFRKEDNMKLQVIVNKVLRSLTGLDRDTPVSVLCSRSGQLSVQQRTALFTMTSVHKSIINKEPCTAITPSAPAKTLASQSACTPTAIELNQISQYQDVVITIEEANCLTKSRPVWPIQQTTQPSSKEPSNGSRTTFRSCPLN